MFSLRLSFLINGFVKILPRIPLLIPQNKSISSLSFYYASFVKSFTLRHMHSSCTARCDKKKWAVSYLAVQELAMSALRRLELEVNKFNRAKKSDIQLILKGSLKDLLVEKEEGIFLLRCCGALLPNENLQTRNHLTKCVWKKICGSGIQLSNDHFIALLKTHFENGHHVCPKDFLLEMKRLSVEPNRDTLIKLLSCSDPKKESKDTMDNIVMIVQELKSRGYSANVEMFEALASTLAEAGDLIGAEDIVETMIKAQLEPTAMVYTSLIRGYVTLGDKSSVLKVLNSMEKRQLSMSGSQYASIVTKLAEIAYASKTNGTQSIIDTASILPLMRVSKGENILQCVSNAVLELVYKEKEGAALILVLSLPTALLAGHRFLEPLPILFCKEVVKADTHSETVVEICDQLESLAVSLVRTQGFLEPFLLHTATGLALYLGKKALSQSLLEALFLRGAPLRPHYFWPIMCMTAKEEAKVKEEGILKLLKKMVDLGIKPDFDTLAHYTLPFLNSKYSALDMLTFLRKGGLTGTVSRTAVTYWLISKGDLQQAANFNEVHHGKINPALLIEPLVTCLVEGKTNPDKSLLANTARLLNSMSKKGVKGVDYVGLLLLDVSEKLGLFANDGREAEGLYKAVEYLLAILKFLDEKNLRISPQAADYLLCLIQPQLDLNAIGDGTKLDMPRVDSSLALTKSEKFHPNIPHPREMSLEELESHLLELRAKGLNERGVLRRLFQIHCRLGNVQRALQIKDELDSGGHSFSPGMLSSLLDLYLRQNMLGKSEEVFQRIKKNHPNFKIDDYKIIDMATLLSSHGRINDGVELLKEHSKTVKVRPGQQIERNLICFLEAVHASMDNKTNKEAKGAGKGKVNGETKNWTVRSILDELLKSGYVNDPPAKSILTWLQKID